MRTTVTYSIPKELDESIKKFADLTNRKQSAVVEMALDDFMARSDVMHIFGKAYEVVNTSILPHPPDGEPVPLVTVAPVEAPTWACEGWNEGKIEEVCADCGKVMNPAPEFTDVDQLADSSEI